MDSRFILPSPKDSFESSGGVTFIKDVLIEGVYQHPVTPWSDPLVVDEAYINRICAATNAAIQAGQRVYVPDGHSNRAEDNTGFVESLFPRKVDGRWRAAARLNIEDAAYAQKVGKTIKDVSPMIVGHPLGTGQSFGERIEHVALCPDPVMPGQGNFVACSLDRGSLNTIDVPVLKTTAVQEPAPMKIKVTDTNVKALSLAGVSASAGAEVEVTAEQFERALSLVQKAQADLAAAQKTVEDTKGALESERSLSITKRLSVDPKTPLFAEVVTSRKAATKAALDLAMSKGRLTKPMRDAVEKMLSVRHGYAMSVETGEAVVVDVAAEVNALLDAIPDNSVVPLGEAGTQPAGGKSQDEAPAFDAKAEAAKTLARTGLGKKPTK